ncbi:MAG: HAD family acid phosphatase [Vulcanimicrobiota bacterium]
MRKTLICFWFSLALAATAQPVPPDSAGAYDKLWVQTSADYRAHCLQTYGWASRSLRERASLEGRHDSQGRLVETTNVREQPLAVIMDLDDTVIDMAVYRTFLYEMKRDFELETWNSFLNYQAEHPEAARSVPGAVEFVSEVERLGYTVFFISNRTEPYRAQTIKVLDRIGISTKDIEKRLILDPGADEDARMARELMTRLHIEESSSEGQALLRAQSRKERRRLQVSLDYRPVAFVGDDLGDFLSFVPEAGADPEKILSARYQAVANERERWGRQYFILPNPMYGNWSPGGSTLPKQGAARFLRDDGFLEYYRASQGK